MPHPALAAALAAALSAGGAPGLAVPAAPVAPMADAASEPTAVPAPAEHAAPAPDALGGALLERAELVRAVLERNRGIDAARLAWQAELERPEQATALPDPRLRYEVAPLSLAGGNRFGQTLALSQSWTLPERRRAAGRAAAAGAAAAAEEYRTLLLDLATAAALAYDDLALIDRALAITAEHERLLEDYLRIAAARYAAGLVEQHEPLRAEVELTHLLHRRVVLEAERPRVVARINALLHRPLDAPLAPPRPPGDGSGEPLPLPSASELAAEAVAGERPELARLDARIAEREAELALARLEKKPDVEAMASVSSMWNESEHRLMVGVAVDLPVWRGRLAAAEAEAEARLAAALAERAHLAAELDAEVAVAAAALAEAERVLELYASRLLPAARDHVQAALAAFEGGKTSFLTLLETEQNLRQVELDAAGAAAERDRRRARLARAVGRLPALDGSPDPPAARAGSPISPVPDVPNGSTTEGDSR